MAWTILNSTIQTQQFLSQRQQLIGGGNSAAEYARDGVASLSIRQGTGRERQRNMRGTGDAVGNRTTHSSGITLVRAWALMWRHVQLGLLNLFK